MIKNYFTIWFRNLNRQKIHSSINILGLAIGLTCMILVLLFIRDEMRYDSFHQNADRTYRIIKETQESKGKWSLSERTSSNLGPALSETFPEVQATTKLALTNIWIRVDGRPFCPEVCITDKGFWDVFSFPLIKGDPKTVFNTPYSVVLTEYRAKKYFGDQDPLGQTIIIEEGSQAGEYRVTGILKNIQHSHFSSGLFIQPPPGAQPQWNFKSTGPRVRTFIQLREGVSPEAFEAKLNDFIRPYAGEERAQNLRYHLQPLTQIYLHTLSGEENRRSIHISRLSLIALLILAIACANFTNLSTALSLRRSKEIGLRKVLGSSKLHLIRQFLAEAILIALSATLLALIFAQLVLPSFNAFMRKDLVLWTLDNSLFLIGLTAFSIILGILAGIYPAFFLASFKTVDALKSRSGGLLKDLWFRRGIVSFQFVTATLLIISTLVIDQQIRFVDTKDLGYDTDGVILNGLFWVDRSLERRREQIVQSYLENPQILKATVVDGATMSYNSGWRRQVRPNGNDAQQTTARLLGVDEDFLDFFDISLIEGRSFSKDISSDLTDAIIINERAMKTFGWQKAIGKTVAFEGRTGTVIGVVKDFHIRTLHEEIPPIILYLRSSRFSFLAVKVHPQHLISIMPYLEEKWETLIPHRPSSIHFLDNRLKSKYREEMKLGQVFRFFTLLAISISCIGLFALSSFLVTQRTKEVGIRKVLGASVPSVVALLSKEFLKLALWSNLIAWPIAYYMMNNWLNDFAYRIDLGLSTFLVGGILTLLIALTTVSYQALKSATADPIETLRQE